jgi:hypothetical protein
MQLPGFPGGVAWFPEPETIADDQLRDILNFHLGPNGELLGRGGSDGSGTAFGAGGDRGLSGHYFARIGASDQILNHDSTGVLRYITGPPFTGAWTTIVSGLGTTLFNRSRFVTYLAKVWMCKPGVGFASWDGTTHTAIGAGPAGTMLESWKEIMWVAGVSSTPDRVYASAIGDPTTWPALGFVDIGKGDGRGITALRTNGEILMVSKEDRTYIIYDPITFANRLVDDEVGAMNHDAVVVHMGMLFFLSHHGIYLFHSDGPAEKISMNLDGAFGAGEIFHADAYATATGYIFAHHHIGFILREIGQSYGNIALDWDMHAERRPWVVNRLPVHFIVSGMDTAMQPELYGLANSTNKVLTVYDYAKADDNSVAFKRQAVTKFYDFGSPLVTKYVRRLKIAGSHFQTTDKVTVKLFTDWERDTPVKSYDVDFEDAGGNLWNDASIEVDLYCRSLSIHLESTPANLGEKDFWVGGTRYDQHRGTPRIGRMELEVIALGDRRAPPSAVVTYL